MLEKLHAMLETLSGLPTVARGVILIAVVAVVAVLLFFRDAGGRAQSRAAPHGDATERVGLGHWAQADVQVQAPDECRVTVSVAIRRQEGKDQ